jgi:hypothetical protein
MNQNGTGRIMRTPNGPLFKRHELVMMLILLVGFAALAGLRIAY